MDIEQFLQTSNIEKPKESKIQFISQITNFDREQSADRYVKQMLFTNLPSTTFDEYYGELFIKLLDNSDSIYLVRCVLNFCFQQLAVRGQVSRPREIFFQIGCFHPTDFPAALIQGMPTTFAHFCSTSNGSKKSEIQDILKNLAAQLSADALPKFTIYDENTNYHNLLNVQTPSSIGYLALLNLQNEDTYSNILPSLKNLLSPLGKCLIIDRPELVEEVSFLAKAENLNLEVSKIFPLMNQTDIQIGICLLSLTE